MKETPTNISQISIIFGIDQKIYIDIYGYLWIYLYFDIKKALPYFQELPNINIFYRRSAIILAFCASSNPVIKFLLVDPLFISFKMR